MNTDNSGITKEVESFLLNIFSENESEPYTFKELVEFSKHIRRKYDNVASIQAYVAWALDMLHFNKIIKRVAPATYESISGPDDVFSERITGYANPGEFCNRGKNSFIIHDLKQTNTPFKHLLSKTINSVKLLKNANYSKEKITELLTNNEFNSVAIKLALKSVFNNTVVME